MRLKDFYNKKVHVIDSHNREWEGVVDIYFYPDENENGKESICVKTSSNSIEFCENLRFRQENRN